MRVVAAGCSYCDERLSKSKVRSGPNHYGVQFGDHGSVRICDQNGDPIDNVIEITVDGPALLEVFRLAELDRYGIEVDPATLSHECSEGVFGGLPRVLIEDHGYRVERVAT